MLAVRGTPKTRIGSLDPAGLCCEQCSAVSGSDRRIDFTLFALTCMLRPGATSNTFSDARFGVGSLGDEMYPVSLMRSNGAGWSARLSPARLRSSIALSSVFAFRGRGCALERAADALHTVAPLNASPP